MVWVSGNWDVAVILALYSCFLCFSNESWNYAETQILYLSLTITPTLMAINTYKYKSQIQINTKPQVLSLYFLCICLPFEKGVFRKTVDGNFYLP